MLAPHAHPLLLWLLTAGAVLFGLGQMYLTLIEVFPTTWVYWHSRTRKPAILLIIVASIYLVVISLRGGYGDCGAVIPLAIQLLMLVFTFRMHQETMFPAIDSPPMTSDLSSLPIGGEEEIALIEVGDVVRAYPLGHVIHHHVVNDQIGDRHIALTYCAMCRTIMAIDVTNLGPLYVASYKNANLVLADRKTRTFFQQASLESIAGPLHPSELVPYPAQVLPWKEVLKLSPPPIVMVTTERDMREFILPLPIPGLWKRIMRSEKTPGLFASSRNDRYPARTPVLGFTHGGEDFVILKSSVLEQPVTPLPKQELVLVTSGESVNGFRDRALGRPLTLEREDATTLLDTGSGTRWDLRGKHLSGELQEDLRSHIISSEYWFAWMKFHPEATLLDLGAQR